MNWQKLIEKIESDDLGGINSQCEMLGKDALLVDILLEVDDFGDGLEAAAFVVLQQANVAPIVFCTDGDNPELFEQLEILAAAIYMERAS